MAEINSFPIQTKVFADLDTLNRATLNLSDYSLVYDDNVGVWKVIEENEKRKFSTFIFPTTLSVQTTNLVEDLDFPVYLRVEETGYKLYKVVNFIARPGDIPMDNGFTAALQIERDYVLVDTVSDISNMLSRASVGDVIETKGCLSIGDGGNGVFDIVASTSLPVDGYSVIGSGPYAVLRFTNGIVNPEQFGAKGDGVTNDYDAIQRAINFCKNKGRGVVGLQAKNYISNSELKINASNIGLVGIGGIQSLITRTNGSYGNTLTISADDPTAETIFDVTLANVKFNSTAAMTSDAHVKIVEAAYCTLRDLSIQNGFIGWHSKGLRASTIDTIHIRSGQLYASIQAGSRFCLIEDSPRALSTSENVEVFMSNFNFTTNGGFYIERGLEIKEADGFWFSNGHIRGAATSNGYLNCQDTPQLLGLKFDNVWFDGGTSICLDIGGDTTNYFGMVELTGCTFTGGTLHAVRVSNGCDLEFLNVTGGHTGYIDGQISWNLLGGKVIDITGHTFNTLNVVNAAAASAVSIGGTCESVNITGGSIYRSPNLEYGIVNNTSASLGVHSVTFKDFSASAKEIELVDKTAIFSSTGCTTNRTGSGGYVTGNTRSGEINNVANDTAVFVDLGEILGATMSVALKFNVNSSGFVAFETSDPSTILKIAGGANLSVTTGVLTGTTGAVGQLTVSITDSGRVYFENRTGVTRNIVWKMLNRDL